MQFAFTPKDITLAEFEGREQGSPELVKSNQWPSTFQLPPTNRMFFQTKPDDFRLSPETRRKVQKGLRELCGESSSIERYLMPLFCQYQPNQSLLMNSIRAMIQILNLDLCNQPKHLVTTFLPFLCHAWLDVVEKLPVSTEFVAKCRDAQTHQDLVRFFENELTCLMEGQANRASANHPLQSDQCVPDVINPNLVHNENSHITDDEIQNLISFLDVDQEEPSVSQY